MLLLVLCASIGLCVGLVTYQHKFAQMTTWQQQQQIDFDKQTGSTKFQAIIDSYINGGLAFCISAIAIIASYKFYKNTKK